MQLLGPAVGLWLRTYGGPMGREFFSERLPLMRSVPPTRSLALSLYVHPFSLSI